MDREKLTPDDVHNWSTPYVQAQWRGKLTMEQCEMVTAAELRHHQRGTSARDEADALNAIFAEQF